ncbi:MBL fold metallo-hydrolase [Paenibacillus sp. 5J-6]|uniref:MBL fold metallo-hydrolase n=1 Tax=Paenibacillus silvestris TaxID=2606219 RepID=A0A6L8UYD0_9BACL|nr:MBL fold metallo-hydrolase [Paenibacillus silvestris]MZQ82226.1 MBL fold metallo-hydrolase [Paenibacillus silvestris]
MSETTPNSLTFLGTTGAIPDSGNDSPCLIINRDMLIDTGWHSIHTMRTLGFDPLEIRYVVFTHFHHDHYMSLPSLLYYWMSRGEHLSQLTIAGPMEDLERIVGFALAFLENEKGFSHKGQPKLIPLRAGESFHTERFHIHTCRTIHPVAGLCYRFEDRRSAEVFSYTGDTAYSEHIIDHVKGSSVLIHETAMGPHAADPGNNRYLHAGAVDAAKVALEAGVKTLYLIHTSIQRSEACVQAAKRIFGGQVIWPEVGNTVII